VASLVQMLMLGSLVGLLGMRHLFQVFKDWKFKSVCGDVVWKIERCPPLLNTCCFAIQRNSMKHYNAKSIARRIVYGILSPCYNGLWFDLKRFAPICHKFWFFVDDLIHCVGRTRKKYCFNRPLVPSMQIRIDLI
jgi:hypothetical protein